MYRIGLLCLSVLFACNVLAQRAKINPQLLDGYWPAYWITDGGASPYDYGVYHFRKSFTLAEKPDRFVVHVSADNRYKLYVNGVKVSSGPAQGDLRNWRYETVDIAEHLKPGKNTLAAVVWNGGEYRPMAQITHRTAFLLQGDTEAEAEVNSNEGWGVLRNEAYAPVTFLDNDPRLQWNYYVAGALDSLQASKYPWGWELPDFDDSGWKKAAQLDRAATPEMESHQKWRVVPSPVPHLLEQPQRFARLARTDLPGATDAFLHGGAPLEVPPHTRGTILVDQGYVTTGYPELTVSGGEGSTVRLVYSEALYDAQFKKGHRDEVEGKSIMGVYDVFMPDGGSSRTFIPLWVRTFRWVQIEVETADEPLRIDDFSSVYTRYPADLTATYESGDESIQKIWETSWRTLEAGAQDVFVSDLYWERIQYVGDTKVQALAWLYATGDDVLYRQALEQFDQSRIPSGLTLSRYPVSLEQRTPLYSLVWITMVHDLWMHRDDDAFFRQFLPGIQQVLGFFERRLNDQGLIGPLPGLDFVDWDYFERRSEIIRNEGRTGLAVHSLFYAYALDKAAELFDHFGQSYEAESYREKAKAVKQAVYELCYDPAKGFFADSPSKQYFSQHANVLAVLTNAVAPEKQADLLKRTLQDESLLRLQLYFRFYLGRALNKTGLSDLYVDMLGPWERMIAMGMTTFGELDGEPRSECHPWSASPTYELLASVAGVEPAEPGFKSVRIAPSLGRLERIRASLLHPKGTIEVSLERAGAEGITGSVRLPDGLTGSFHWNDKVIELKGGEQTINL